MIVGNLVALAQKNIKRMLAYSSIAHAGYILVAIAIGTPAATSAFMFYLLAYTLATFGAFGVIIALLPELVPAQPGWPRAIGHPWVDR